MSLDVSEAIALAKDLLQTSSDFQRHDPDLAAEFSHRAYEICDDLGIDHALVAPAGEPEGGDPGLEVREPSSKSVVTSRRDLDEDDARETSEQLRSLLQQQAQVIRDIQQPDPAPVRKTRRPSFRLFARHAQQRFGHGQLQSA